MPGALPSPTACGHYDRGLMSLTTPPRRLIVALTGASGSIFGIRLLERLRQTDVESHLVLSRWGARTLVHETDYTVDQVQQLATTWYSPNDQGAAISSGSFVTMGMIVLPCSVKTLAEISHGIGDTLRHPRGRRRAEGTAPARPGRARGAAPRNPPREHAAPDTDGRDRLAAGAGVLLAPRTIDDLVDHTVARMLDLFDIHTDGSPRWDGQMEPQRSVPVLPARSLNWRRSRSTTSSPAS